MKWIKRFVTRLSLMLAVALVAWIGSVESGYSQNAADTTTAQTLLETVPADSLTDNAAKLVSRIKRGVDVLENIQGKLVTASSEDSLVLRLQLTALVERTMTDVHELADVLAELEKEGPQTELRVEVEELHIYLAPRVWTYIDKLRVEIDRTRARRVFVSGTDRLVLEDRMVLLTGWLDNGFEIGQTHIAKMKVLGLDVTEATAGFVQLLGDRADELSGRIALALERVDEMAARLKDAPDDADLRVNLVAAHKSLDVNTTSMAIVLDIMDTFELPTQDYRAQLVTATRDLAAGLLDKDVAAGLLGRAVTAAKDWLIENGPGLLVKFLLIFVILFIFRILARLVRKGISRALDASSLNVSTLLRRMILTSAANAVLILGLLIALSQLGITLGPLLAGLGVAGFIVGFALQDTLANFAAGMMILIYRPYDVGDMVEAGGVFGKVDKMSLVSTTILTIDNQTIVVPNSKIWGDVIKNVTAQDIRRVDMVFGISYTDDIPKAEQVLEDILKTHDKVLDDPPSVVKLHTLGESSVDFVVRPWVAAGDYWDVYWDVTRAVKMRFDEEGISIPFPQRDVHIYEKKVAEKKGQAQEV